VTAYFALIVVSLLQLVTSQSLGDDEVLAGVTSAEILASDWSNGQSQRDDGKTIDEVILDAGVEAGEEAAAQEGTILFQSDMMMQPTQFLESYSSKGYSGAAAVEKYRWPHAIIPYTIDAALDGEPARVAMGAMKEWMERTCVRFEPAGSDAAEKAGHNNAIKIIDGGGCRSGIGYWGRPYEVSLARKGCTRHKSHLHELGHAIGLHHEHNRPDRDDHIQLWWANLGMFGSTQYVKETDALSYGIPYDYCSVMHYGPKYYSANRKFTMLSRDQDYQWSMGSAQNLSFYDAMIVNKMYKCDKHCTAAAKNSCNKSTCYLNHKCECECLKEVCKKIPCTAKSSKRECDQAAAALKRLG